MALCSGDAGSHTTSVTMSSDTASSEAGSHEGQNDQRGVELASKVLNVDKRRFYIDLKENDRGRFVQVVALMPGGRKNRLFMTMPIVKSIVGLLDKVTVTEDTEYPKEVGRASSGKRVYFVDLRKNDHGNFLRLTQAFTRAPKRYQIYIPAEGLEEFKKLLQELLNEFGVGESDDSKLPPSQQMRDVRNKMFYFDCNRNDYGDYLRITETRFSSENRTSITISVKNLPRFHEILGDLLKSFRELRVTEEQQQQPPPPPPQQQQAKPEPKVEIKNEATA